MNIEVDLPVDNAGGPSDGPPPPQQVEIIVPDGCWPGMEFTVEFEGRSFNIVVPDGCEPGMALNVEVPAGEEEPPPPPPPPPATTPWELVGRRAALCGLIAKAILRRHGREREATAHDRCIEVGRNHAQTARRDVRRQRAVADDIASLTEQRFEPRRVEMVVVGVRDECVGSSRVAACGDEPAWHPPA